jgi:fructokinase
MSETKAPKIVGIGELLWDLLPSGPRQGGAPANFTVFCARLGNRSVLVSRIGDDDYGRTTRNTLVQPNLDLSQLQLDEAHPTGTVEVTFSPDNQPSYCFPINVAWDLIALTPELLQAARDANAICFGTLGQRHEVSRSTTQTLVAATAAECVRVCDINIRMPWCSPEVLHWSMAYATIIKISDEELPRTFAFLRELGIATRQIAITPESAAQWMLETFPGCVLVATTLGPHGSLVTTREGEFRHPGFPIKLVDSVGAGDAFTAGLLHAYLRGASPLQMAEIGNLCGSYVAGQAGATPALSAELIETIRAVLGSGLQPPEATARRD